MLPLSTRSWSRLLAGALLALLCGCRGPDVRPELAAAGFRTPEQTFATYRAAFLADLSTLEYRCFSSGFCRANGLSALNYAEARDVLLRERSFLKFGLGRARIVAVEPLAADRVRLRIRSKSLFHDLSFACELVREDYYELWEGGRRVQDDHLRRFADAFRVTESGERSYAQAFVPLDDPALGPRLTEVRVGREWKIDFLARLDAESPPQSPPESTDVPQD